MRYFLTILIVIVLLTNGSPIRADVRDEIEKLVPEASAMKQADFEKLARSAAPKQDDFEEKSLTLMLLHGVQITPGASEAQNKEFRYQQPPPNPVELADEVYRIASRAGNRVMLKGPVTLLSADRITNVTAEVEGDEATGTVSFRAPDLYDGQVQYAARRPENAWRITEWRMPAHDIHLVYGLMNRGSTGAPTKRRIEGDNGGWAAMVEIGGERHRAGNPPNGLVSR